MPDPMGERSKNERSLSLGISVQVGREQLMWTGRASRTGQDHSQARGLLSAVGDGRGRVLGEGLGVPGDVGEIFLF